MLTVADFLRPIGRIDPDLMGGTVKATTTIGNLLTAAQARTSDEAAQTCFVYWKAFEQIADDAMATPSMQRDRDKADQVSAEQLAHWRTVAREYEQCFHARLTGNSSFAPATSVTVDVVPTW